MEFVPTMDHLAHHGIVGMKWGVRRYQPYSTVPRSSGKGGKEIGEAKKASSANPTSSRTAKKASAAVAKKAEETMTEEEKKARYEAAKAQALKSGSARDIIQFKGDLTQQEMQNALNRLNLERQLSSLSAAEKKSGWDKLTAISDKVGKATDFAEKGIKVYNTIAKVNNSLSDGPKMKLIGDGNKGNNKDGKNNSPKISDRAEKLIRAGNYEAILRNQSSFTTDEIQAAISRYSKVEDLRKKVGRTS